MELRWGRGEEEGKGWRGKKRGKIVMNLEECGSKRVLARDNGLKKARKEGR